MPDLIALRSLLDSSQKKLGEVVILAIWGGCGYALKLAWEGFQGWRAVRKAVKQSNPVYLAGKQIQLNIAADRACRWAGAAHTSIYQFSNGQFFTNGDSIQKVSMVAEAVENNALARWLTQSQNLTTAGFPNLLRALDKGHVWLYRDECEDFELERYMRERGYTSRLVGLLTGKQGVWLGLLVISFSEGYFTDEHINLAMFEEHRRACASILANP
ncbi:hypothetical protein GCM10027422_43330 [Hymenobacter arcticus]